MQKKIMTCIALTSLVVGMANTASAADESGRSGRWELYGFGQYMKISDIFNSDANVGGGGIGLGYNLSEHFTLNADFSINAVETDYHPFLSERSWRETTTLYVGNVSLDWNILGTPLTPVISGGAGVGWFANAQSGAYFDPNIGAGLRWDVSDHVLIKAMARATWWYSSEHRDLGVGILLAIGYKF
jgi:hypothetical protein